MEGNASEEAFCEADSHAVAAVPVVVSVLWALFCFFYHTRLLAVLVSWLVNWYSTNTHIKIGSLRVSLLSGRILFRNVHYTTLDYSMSVVDGYVSLKWWKGPRNVYHDWRVVDVNLQLNGVQFHWYNRSEVCKQLEKRFFEQKQRNPGESADHISAEVEASDSDTGNGHSWFGITPNISCNINKVKILFGNDQILDYILVVYLRKGLLSYSHQLSPCHYDQYRYVVRCDGVDMEAFWEPNKCLLVNTSNRVERMLFGRSQLASFAYTVDVPGITPNNRESAADVPSPEFLMDLTLERSAEIHYGPAINRHRALFQKLFFPGNYSEAEVTKFPNQGEKRIYAQLVVTVTLVDGGQVVLPFANKKSGQVDSLKLMVDSGSHVKVIQPWITFSDGYTTIVEGTFYSPSLTSSLIYKPVGQANFVKLRTDLHFPRLWNALQTWDMQISIDQLNCNILFPYIDFIGDLLDDWNAGPPPELFSFTPLQWQIAIQLCSYEVFLYTNHYNWVDVASLSKNENSRLAVCGETGTLNFNFPFTEFLPAEQKISFTAEGQNLALRRYVPPSSTTKESIFALSQINKHRWRWPSHTHQGGGAADTDNERFPLGWVHNTTYQDGWVDLACSSNIMIHLTHSNYAHSVSENGSSLRPNVLQVEIEVPNIMLRIFGVLARDLLGLKENYTGDFPNLTAFNSTTSEPLQADVTTNKENNIFPPMESISTDDFYGTDERFPEIHINFKLPNGTAEFPIHLPRDVDEQGLPLPSAHADMLQVEFAYRQHETRVSIQAITTSILIPTQGCLDGKTILGQLTIPSIVFRGHGLNETLCRERVEYAWLMDIDVGGIEGAIATEQVMIVVDWLEASIPHVVSLGDEMEVAPGGLTFEPVVEPLVAVVKYRSFTVSVRQCDVSLLEEKQLLRLVVPGFGLAACNLQNNTINWGITFLLHGIQAHIYSTPEHSLSTMAVHNPSLRMTELGQMMVGRIRGQLHIRNPDEYFPSRQLQFLLKADALQRRLFFLWPAVHPVYCVNHSLYDSESVCGCFGGCRFFDTTLEKNKYFVQLQQENMPGSYGNTPKSQRRGLLKRSLAVGTDEPDCPPLVSTQFSGRNSIYAQYLDRCGSFQQRQIPARENPLSSSSGVTHVHTMLARLSCKRNAEDFADYSSMMTLNRNSLNSLNSRIVETVEDTADGVAEAKGDKEEQMTTSSSVESFMSALSQLESDTEEPSEEPQPTTAAKELPNAWTSSVTFCPYIISTQLSARVASNPPAVAILCPRYRSHLSSFLPKVSLKMPSDDMPGSPVTAKISVNVQLVEKCSVRITPSVLEALECFVKTAERCLERRNPIAVVDQLLDKCLSYTSTMIQQNKACNEKAQGQQQQQQQQQLQQQQHQQLMSPPLLDGSNLPSLYFTAGMSTHSHISVQMIGSHKANKPIASTSLLTVFAAGISYNALVKKHSSPCDATSLPARRIQLEKQSSLSSTINCQALQLQIVTLNVNGCHAPTIGSPKLNFVLKLPSHASRIGVEMKNVIEMGVAGAEGTVVGTNKNVVTPNILSSLSSTTKLPKNGESVPANLHRVATMLQLKEVWLLVTTPHKSTVHDLSLTCGFANQWHLTVSSCASSIKKMLNVKAQQEKRVLAHLISDCLQKGEDIPDMSSKIHSPLTKDSQKLRSSTAYQMCRVLPFSKMTTTNANFTPPNVSIVAMAMGLGSKIFRRKQQKSSARRSQNIQNTDYESCKNIKQLDHESLRLLQHAIIPLLWSCGLKVEGKPVNSQTEIEVAVTLNLISVQILDNHMDDDGTTTPEMLVKDFLFKCNVNSDSHTEGTCSLLFDMEKSLPLILEGLEQRQQSRTIMSKLNTCATINFGTFKVNASVPLLRYISIIPTVKKSCVYIMPSSMTDSSNVENVDEPDSGCVSEQLDPFSRALVLALMEKDGNSPPVAQLTPALTGSLPSSVHQADSGFPKPPTMTSFDILLRAEEGQGLDQSSCSHAYNSNQLRVPHTAASGSESYTPAVSDETDCYPPPVRTPSSESFNHQLVSGRDRTQQETESSSSANSFFLLISINEIVLSAEVFPLRVSLALQTLTGSVNVTSGHSQQQSKGIIPTHVSVSGTLQETVLKLSDIDINTELASFTVAPIITMLVVNYRRGDVTDYRSVIQTVQARLDVKHSPIVIHRQIQKNFSSLQQLYQELFPPSDRVVHTEMDETSMPAAAQPLPVGSIQVVIKNVSAVINPLPSLTVSYQVPSLMLLLETNTDLRFSLDVADSVLRFSPKVYKDELASGKVPLPPIYLGGTLFPPNSMVSRPSLDLELMIKEINVDLTTDVLNQLLVVQIAFIKELNELVQTIINTRETIKGTTADDELFSKPNDASKDLLRSVQFTLQGTTVTVTTPSSTAAIRFSTTKIDALIKKSSSTSKTSRSIMALSGRVEVDLTLALGHLMNSLSDDFKELILFETKISIKNSSRSGASADTVDGLSPDSFHITIQLPHLFLQPSGIEKALIFWVHCESAYTHWLEERKAVTDEVQKATTQFMDNISTVEAPNASTLNFQQPKLIQISVNDLGACIPLVPMANSPFNTQKGFPALVLGIKEMRIALNLSHRVVSKGHFTSFGLRFTESFNPRQRVWATLTKKKMINQASVPKGTYSLCMDRKRPTGIPPQEKIICFFQFLMSGLELHANSMMGRYVSLLTKAFVSLKGEQTAQVQATRSSSGLERERTRAPRSLRKKGVSASTLTSIEHNLAKQSQIVNKLRQLGQTDKLQLEINKLQKLEALATDQWKKSRRRKNTQISFGNLTTRLLSPFSKPAVSKVGAHHRRTESLLVSSTTTDNIEKVNSAAANLTGSSTLEVNPVFKKGHRRAKSDIHDIATTLALSGESDESRPPSRLPSQASTHDDEIEDDRLSLASIPSRTPSPTSTPVFEISITVEVESGKMFFYHQLYEGDTAQDIKQKPYYSPMLAARSAKINTSASAVFPRKLLTGRPSATKDPDVTIFIPAVHFYSHYYSTVVSELRATSSESRMSKMKNVNFRLSPPPAPPSKKGSLLFSVNIDSLPEEMKLQPSLLEFMEQVMKPLKGNPDSSLSNESDSAESDSESGPALPQSPTAPASISFPVEVTIFFHVKRSKVTLSCQPYSRVECDIAVPDVNLCCSFVLFSPQLAENSTSKLSSSSASSVLSSNVQTFNNLCVSGAVQSFSFNIFNPSISSTARTDKSSTETKKEVIGLFLGLASVHISRQAVKVMPSPNKDSYEKMKISVVVDIASIRLGFDMRRLNDVTAFRKCWYRKSVVESFMLGSHQKKSTTSSSSKPLSKQKTTAIPEERAAGDPQEGQQELTHAEIVCVASIADLSCTANVATVMGNATVVLDQLIVEACADVKSSEIVYLNLECVLYRANMDARNGVIAGDLHLEHTKFEVMTSCERDAIPKHTCAAQMKLLEARVDFMMSSVVAATAKDISVDFHDDWNNALSQESRSSHSNEYIQVTCNMCWDQAKLVICRSTAASLEEIVKKLKEFVLQQKRRSKRTFLLMWPETTPATTTPLSTVDEVDSTSTDNSEEAKYHHWHWGTKASCSSLLEALGFTMAANKEHTVSFMGTIGITGNSVCLACLHGPSFRETEWAIFSLCNIAASFSTQAIPSFIMSAHSHKVGWGLDNRRICRQSTMLTLGNNKTDAQCQFGSVFRVVNRGTMPPLTGYPLAEWVSFVCIDHHIHPNLPQNKLFKFTRKVSISGVFGIPALKLEMIHDHFYPSKSLSCEAKQITANVVCSFLTKFQNSIAITTAAEHYFFLHDLVKLYVESYTKSKRDNGTTVAKAKAGGDKEPEVKIKRKFSTEEWQLDPHLVLLAGNSWTSGTVNIGWLLERLGFQEAKITIPESIQCGVMDLLDYTISIMVKRLLSVSAKKKLA